MPNYNIFGCYKTKVVSFNTIVVTIWAGARGVIVKAVRKGKNELITSYN